MKLSSSDILTRPREYDIMTHMNSTTWTTENTHDNCEHCDSCAEYAKTMATVTGSVGATHRTNVGMVEHSATVTRNPAA